MTSREHTHIALGWSISEYDQIIMKAGDVWAALNYGNDLADELVKSSMFWKWWDNEWMIRDEDFLRETSIRFITEPLYGEALTIAQELWIEKHRVKDLKIKMNRLVYEDLRRMLEEMKAEKEKRIAEKDEELSRLEATRKSMVAEPKRNILQEIIKPLEYEYRQN